MIGRAQDHHTLHARRENREVAARWHWIGSLPLVERVGSLVASFDGLVLRIGFGGLPCGA